MIADAIAKSGRTVVAVAAELHVTETAVENWKKGGGMKRANAERLAALLDVPLSAFWIDEAPIAEVALNLARYERFAAGVERLLRELRAEEAVPGEPTHMYQRTPGAGRKRATEGE